MRYLLFTFLLLISFSCTKSVDENRVIDTQKFSQLITEKDKTLVYVWTTWCSGCRKSLSETLPKLMQNLNTEEYQLILIAVSKNKAEVDSLIESSGLATTSYLLDFFGPDKGSFQSIGIRQFLSANFKGEKIYTGGIPVFFLVDSNKEILQKKLPHSYDDVIQILR